VPGEGARDSAVIVDRDEIVPAVCQYGAASAPKQRAGWGVEDQPIEIRVGAGGNPVTVRMAPNRHAVVIDAGDRHRAIDKAALDGAAGIDEFEEQVFVIVQPDASPDGAGEVRAVHAVAGDLVAIVISVQGAFQPGEMRGGWRHGS
jgi:hypothetical protein